MWVKASGEWIWTGGAGASTDIRSVELDFGATPSMRGEWTVNDSSVSATSNVMVMLSHETLTGRDADEAEVEPMHCFAAALAAGSFKLIALPVDGPVTGVYRFNYLIG